MKIFLAKIGVLSTGSFTRVFLQAITLIILARNMPINDYGSLVVIVSLLTILLPLGSLGYDFTLLRESSLNKDLSNNWHRFVLLTLLTWITITILTTMVASIVGLSIGIISIFLLSFCEVFCMRYTEGINRIYQGKNDTSSISHIRVIFSFAKLSFTLLLVEFSEEITVNDYAASAFAAGLFSIIYARLHMKRKITILKSTQQVMTLDLFSSISSAVALSLDKVGACADKIFLSKLASPETTAIYSVANRIVELLTIPLLSFITIKQPEYFKNKNFNISKFQLLLIPLIYIGIIATPIYYLGETIIKAAIGDNFGATHHYLLMMLFIPAISFIKYNLTSKAIAIEANKILVTTTIIASTVNCIANILLIPLYGGAGAVLSLYISELTLIVLLQQLIRYQK